MVVCCYLFSSAIFPVFDLLEIIILVSVIFFYHSNFYFSKLSLTREIFYTQELCVKIISQKKLTKKYLKYLEIYILL